HHLQQHTTAKIQDRHCNAWCELVGGHQSIKSTNARRGRPSFSFNQIQKLGKLIIAARRVSKPSSACGRSRSNRKAKSNLSCTVSTIWRLAANQRRSRFGQRTWLLRLGGQISLASYLSRQRVCQSLPSKPLSTKYGPLALAPRLLNRGCGTARA